MRGNKTRFDLILIYFQSGKVYEPLFSASSSDDMNSIRDQAERFQLKALCEHIGFFKVFFYMILKASARYLTTTPGFLPTYTALKETSIYVIYTLGNMRASTFRPHSSLHNPIQNRSVEMFTSE